MGIYPFLLFFHQQKNNICTFFRVPTCCPIYHSSFPLLILLVRCQYATFYLEKLFSLFSCIPFVNFINLTMKIRLTFLVGGLLILNLSLYHTHRIFPSNSATCHITIALKEYFLIVSIFVVNGSKAFRRCNYFAPTKLWLKEMFWMTWMIVLPNYVTTLVGYLIIWI